MGMFCLISCWLDVVWTLFAVASKLVSKGTHELKSGDDVIITYPAGNLTSSVGAPDGEEYTCKLIWWTMLLPNQLLSVTQTWTLCWHSIYEPVVFIQSDACGFMVAWNNYLCVLGGWGFRGILTDGSGIRLPYFWELSPLFISTF